MDYNSAIEYINSFINFEKIEKYNYASSFKLDRMRAFLKDLGNPHENLNVLHVAGSKGKGSTCAITAYILKEAGFRVGLYTSPHLMDFRERIRVLGGGQAGPDRFFEGMIAEDEFIDLIDGIKDTAEKFRDHKAFGAISFFEIVTACAFLYFKKKKVDFAVLETGLGGRLDATNVTAPLVCGITNISLEHTDKLGRTLDLIAFEKAGIIKPAILGAKPGFVVTASQEKEVMDVIRNVAKSKMADLYKIGKDINYTIVNPGQFSQEFNLEGPGYSYKNLKLNLAGSHQAENASLAIAMLKLLEKIKLNITEDIIREGLDNAVWPGRLQIIQKDPYIILDGAHNVASITALLNSIRALFKYNKLISIFGMSSDKDIKGVSALLNRYSDIIILTKAKGNNRAKEPISLRENFPDSRKNLELTGNIDEALQKAMKLADQKDLILATGSLFIVGDAMRYLGYEQYAAVR